MSKTPTEVHLDQAKRLTKEETERVLSRMRTKLMRRLDDNNLSTLEMVAIQLEVEEEALDEWREKVAEIKKRTKGK